MATIFPFHALRARAELASRVAAVPYDVVGRREARELAAGNALSFLHVTKPEIDLPDDVDPYADTVYEHGGQALRGMVQAGTLVRDPLPSLYLYALTIAGATQTGFGLCVSVREYEANLVRKHEHTRPDKENDRVRHIQATDAQTGLVFLVHRRHEVLAAVAVRVSAAPPAIDFTAQDGVRHRLWVIQEPGVIDLCTRSFKELGPLYIADGHHRSAAAARVAAARRGTAGQRGPEPSWEYFVAVSFPEDEVRIFPYNRVVHDLQGHGAEDLLGLLRRNFAVREGKTTRLEPRHFHMLLQNRWYNLCAKEELYAGDDPVARLDVSVLQDRVLSPLLGIHDPRRDTRIDFVGGVRGDAELERRVREGAAVAFALHPVRIQDLLAIADVERVMPPKSTWFEPKLRDGLLVHQLS